MSSAERFPRELTPIERDLLLWILPADRPGYSEYRKFLEHWRVAAVGRRGEGNYILAEPGVIIDTESPLPPLFAYGVVECEEGNSTVSLRERSGGQLEFELEGPSLASAREIRRWSFSDWMPTHPCPSCRSTVREIRMSTTSGGFLSLVLCNRDRRIWVFDELSQVNALIPVTGFYNELMLQTGIKDPGIALAPNRLFGDQGSPGDSDLIRAFASYNKVRNKVAINGAIHIVVEPDRNWLQRVAGAILGQRKL